MKKLTIGLVSIALLTGCSLFVPPPTTFDLIGMDASETEQAILDNCPAFLELFGNLQLDQVRKVRAFLDRIPDGQGREFVNANPWAKSLAYRGTVAQERQHYKELISSWEQKAKPTRNHNSFPEAELNALRSNLRDTLWVQVPAACGIEEELSIQKYNESVALRLSSARPEEVTLKPKQTATPRPSAPEQPNASSEGSEELADDLSTAPDALLKDCLRYSNLYSAGFERGRGPDFTLSEWFAHARIPLPISGSLITPSYKSKAMSDLWDRLVANLPPAPNRAQDLLVDIQAFCLVTTGVDITD